MLRAPESKTLFWRSSWCGGRGCWWRSGRMSFMGISLPLSGEGALSPHRATTQRGQEPSGRKDGRFSAALKAEGGVHRPIGRPTRGTCAYCINTTEVSQGYAGIRLGVCPPSAACTDGLGRREPAPGQDGREDRREHHDGDQHGELRLVDDPGVESPSGEGDGPTVGGWAARG